MTAESQCGRSRRNLLETTAILDTVLLRICHYPLQFGYGYLYVNPQTSGLLRWASAQSRAAVPAMARYRNAAPCYAVTEILNLLAHILFADGRQPRPSLQLRSHRDYSWNRANGM